MDLAQSAHQMLHCSCSLAVRLKHGDYSAHLFCCVTGVPRPKMRRSDMFVRVLAKGNENHDVWVCRREGAASVLLRV